VQEMKVFCGTFTHPEPKPIWTGLKRRHTLSPSEAYITPIGGRLVHKYRIVML